MIFGRNFSRLLLRFFARPILPFAIEFLLLAPLILGLDEPGVGPIYLFLSPLIVPVLGALNFPLTFQVFRLFRMDSATRRNHALEHATIHFLMSDGKLKFGGEAEDNGFRISGGAKAEEIRMAFAEVAALVKAGRGIPHVSRHCGSNLVTALALAMILLLLVSAACLLIRPPLVVRAGLLGGVVVVFVLMRHTVGNRIQARFFMATDFADVAIRYIRDVQPNAWERGPVRFVETSVTLAPKPGDR